MPTWTLDTSVGSLVTRDAAVAVPEITGVKPAGPVFDKDASHHLTERLHAARRTKEAAAQPGLVVGTDESSATFGVIAEARALMKQKKHLEALRLIAPLIRTAPKDSQLRQVRLDIREAMENDVLDFTAELQSRKDFAKALATLEDLLQLDPAVGMYHCARVQTLMIAGRLEEATAASQQAVAHCHGDENEILEGLRDEVTRRRLQAALEPARQYYRAAKYRKARKEMEATRGQWSHEPLWQVFQTYLEDLGGNLFWGGHKPHEVKPGGDLEIVDRLHFFLVREEIAVGKALLEEDPRPALPVLRKGLSLAPHFPYLNYLVASCAYETVTEDMANGELDLDRSESLLREARGFATVGATDPEITSASNLLELIDGFLETAKEVRRRLEERRRQMADLFEPLARRFRDFMNSVQNGIESTEHFRRLQKLMRDIRQGIPPARKKATDEQVVAFLDQLQDAADRHWKQLEKIEPDVVAAEKLTELRKRMESVVNPESLSVSSLPVAMKRLSTAREDAQALKNSNGSKDAREAAGNLLDEITDMTVLAPIFAALNDALRKVTNHEIYGQRDVLELRRQLQAVRSSATNIRAKVKTDMAKRNVDQMVTMTGEFLQQMGG